MSGPKVVLVETGEVIALKGVHPVADLFPMLDEEGIGDLAASIAERGQEHPIVLDDEDRVGDGRNRLAACVLAGLDVTATRYDGDDIAGYILAVNLNRRDMTKGQRAMVAAEAGALSQSTLRNIEKATGISNSRLAYASTVLTHAPDLTASVRSGARSLDDAYAEARRRKDDAAEAERQRGELRAKRPDLADTVDAELATLREAMDVLRAEEKEEHRRQLVETHLLCEHVVVIAQCKDQDIGGYYNPEMVLPGRAVTRKVLADAATAIDQLSAIWKERDLP